jgi:hypothetical protein
MAKKTATKKTSIGKPAPVVYIGPNLPGGQLSAFTVFRNGLPAHVAEIEKQHPEISRLIVPVRELPAARQKLHRHGAEALAYKAVAQKYNL